jgi:hypothetical protein
VDFDDDCPSSTINYRYENYMIYGYSGYGTSRCDSLMVKNNEEVIFKSEYTDSKCEKIKVPDYTLLAVLFIDLVSK